MVYIILATIFYAAGILLAALATRSANNAVVTTVMNITSALLPIALIVPAMARGGLTNQKTGVIYALLAGVMIGFFTLALNKSYAENKVGIVVPIVFGGAIFLSTLLSSYFFKEKISSLQWAGLVVLGVGFLIVIYARITGK